MLTVKEHTDGKLYHAQYAGYDLEDDTLEDDTLEDDTLEFILDEYGDLIPANICLCFAKEPSECCCGCTSLDIHEKDVHGFDY